MAAARTLTSDGLALAGAEPRLEGLAHLARLPAAVPLPQLAAVGRGHQALDVEAQEDRRRLAHHRGQDRVGVDEAPVLDDEDRVLDPLQQPAVALLGAADLGQGQVLLVARGLLRPQRVRELPVAEGEVAVGLAQPVPDLADVGGRPCLPWPRRPGWPPRAARLAAGRARGRPARARSRRRGSPGPGRTASRRAPRRRPRAGTASARPGCPARPSRPRRRPRPARPRRRGRRSGRGERGPRRCRTCATAAKTA